jgi:hypothetical protein
VTTPSIRPDERVSLSPKEREYRERPVIRWAWVVVAVTLCLSIGLPLIGTRVFFPSDLLQRFHPWKDQTPPGYRIANPLLTDPVDATMPTRAEYRRRVLAGDYPMWLPEPTGGGPLGTVPTWSMWSPLELPYLVLPLWYAPALVKLLEMAVAVGFMYLFARRLGLGRIPGIVGGLVYAFSGFQVVWTFWPQSHMGAMIPALFWAAERGLQRGTIRSMLPVAAVVAFMVLEGFPPVLLYAVVAAGLYVLVRMVAASEQDVARRLKGIASFGGAAALGLSLTAFQVLPFLDQQGTLELGYRAQTADSHLPLRALVTLFVPNAFGSPVDGTFFGRRHYAPTGFVRTGYLEQQSFIGATALVLILVAAIALWRRPESNPLPRGVKSYLWLGLGLMVILMYVGGPALGALQKVPPFGTNYIGRMRAVMGLFLACLAALGLQSLQDWRARRSRSEWLFGAAVVTVAVASAGLGLWRVLVLAGEVDLRRYVLRQSILPVVAAAVAATAIILSTRPWGRERRIASWVVPPLVAIEALAFVLPFWPRVAKWTFYPTTPAHRFLQAHLGHDRTASQGYVLYPGTTIYYGLRSVTGHQFPQRTWTDVLTALSPNALHLPTLPVIRGRPAMITSPLLDRLSARYFVDAPEDPELGKRVDPGAVVGTVALSAGGYVSATVPGGSIRGVGVRVVRAEGWPGSGMLTAQVLDRAGAVRSTGRLHLRSVRPGELTIPVVEQPASTTGGSVRIRLGLRAGGGRLFLAADASGGPAASAFLGEDDGLRLVFADGATIYQRLHALPRIRWASRAEVILDPTGRIDALSRGVDPDTVVLSASGPQGSGRMAGLRVLQDGGDEIRVSVTTSGRGYLVVADAIQHGWKASLDDRPVVMQAADHAGVAVVVPPGRHLVAFRYDPPGWSPGLVVSGISLVLLIALAVFLPRRPLPREARW